MHMYIYIYVYIHCSCFLTRIPPPKSALPSEEAAGEVPRLAL